VVHNFDRVSPFPMFALMPSNNWRSVAMVLKTRMEYWQLANVIDLDDDGNYVIFVPYTPDTNKGHVLLAKQDQSRIVSSVAPNQMDASLKRLGGRTVE